MEISFSKELQTISTKNEIALMNGFVLSFYFKKNQGTLTYWGVRVIIGNVERRNDMCQTDNLCRAHEIVAQLRACGHFLYYRMGGHAGRRRILTILSEHSEIMQKELQDILQIQSGSLSEVMIKLEADGLVEKGKSKMDGRQWTIRLTKNGEQQAERMKTVYDEQVAKMMDCFTQEQLDMLHELLDTMFSHWNEVDLCPEHKNLEKENE